MSTIVQRVWGRWIGRIKECILDPGKRPLRREPWGEYFSVSDSESGDAIIQLQQGTGSRDACHGLAAATVYEPGYPALASIQMKLKYDEDDASSNARKMQKLRKLEWDAFHDMCKLSRGFMQGDDEWHGRVLCRFESTMHSARGEDEASALDERRHWMKQLIVMEDRVLLFGVRKTISRDRFGKSSTRLAYIAFEVIEFPRSLNGVKDLIGNLVSDATSPDEYNLGFKDTMQEWNRALYDVSWREAVHQAQPLHPSHRQRAELARQEKEKVDKEVKRLMLGSANISSIRWMQTGGTLVLPLRDDQIKKSVAFMMGSHRRLAKGGDSHPLRNLDDDVMRKIAMDAYGPDELNTVELMECLERWVEDPNTFFGDPTLLRTNARIIWQQQQRCGRCMRLIL